MLVLKPNLLFKASKRKRCNLTVEREFKAQGYLIGWCSPFGEHIYRSSYINFLAEKRHLATLSELGNIYPAWSNSRELVILAPFTGFLEFPNPTECFNFFKKGQYNPNFETKHKNQDKKLL